MIRSWVVDFKQCYHKQEANGPHPSPGKFAQSRHNYYTIMLIMKKNIYLFIRIEWSLFVRTRVPFTQGCFVPSLFEIGTLVLAKNMFSSLSIHFPFFVIFLPLEKGKVLHLKTFEFSLPKDALCYLWLKLSKRFCRRKLYNFINASLLFHNYIPSRKNAWPFIWSKTLTSLTRVSFLPGLVEIMPMVLEKTIFI